MTIPRGPTGRQYNTVWKSRAVLMEFYFGGTILLVSYYIQAHPWWSSWIHRPEVEASRTGASPTPPPCSQPDGTDPSGPTSLRAICLALMQLLSYQFKWDWLIKDLLQPKPSPLLNTATPTQLNLSQFLKAVCSGVADSKLSRILGTGCQHRLNLSSKHFLMQLRGTRKTPLSSDPNLT